MKFKFDIENRYKYGFIVCGENKKELKQLQEKLATSKHFFMASSAMSIHRLTEGV